MSDTIVKIDGIGKKYRIRHKRPERYSALRDVIAGKARSIFQSTHRSLSERPAIEDFWALKDVSFEVKRGEVVGIIGRNGAGKSTLLKILSRITEPTEGRVEIDGRVSSLLEVGTGFHPELTGRENIYLNGAILGMGRLEIKQKLDEIVAFAEVEEFLDTPVKRFSSGMYLRLAFAVAAHLEPEILIVDEVLAVGDAAFQKKCLGKMSAAAQEGRTVLFVSHNMGAVTTLTRECIYLEEGRIFAAGKTQHIVETYLARSLDMKNDRAFGLDFYRRDRNDESPVKITDIRARGAVHRADDLLSTIEVGDNFVIEIELDVVKALQGANVTIILKNSKGECVTVLVSLDRNFALFLEPGRHKLIAQISGLPLVPGQYVVDMGIDPSVVAEAFDVIIDYPIFRVVNNGQITQWLDRPWGILHCNSVEWETASVGAEINNEEFAQP